MDLQGVHGMMPCWMAAWLLCGLLCLPTAQPALPDLSWDVHTQDLLTSIKDTHMQQQVAQLRKANSGLPNECRTDLCEETVHPSLGKGFFKFKTTGVGFRNLVRCPYSFDDQILGLHATYGSMDCILVPDYNGNLILQWGNFQDGYCPFGPITVLTDRLRKEMVNITTKEWLESAFMQLHSIIIKYPEPDPHRYGDEMIVALDISNSYITTVNMRSLYISAHRLVWFLDVADYFCKHDSIIRTPLKSRIWFVKSLSRLVTRLEVPPSPYQMPFTLWSFQRRVKVSRTRYQNAMHLAVVVHLVTKDEFPSGSHITAEFPNPVNTHDDDERILDFLYLNSSHLLHKSSLSYVEWMPGPTTTSPNQMSTQDTNNTDGVTGLPSLDATISNEDFHLLKTGANSNESSMQSIDTLLFYGTLVQSLPQEPIVSMKKSIIDIAGPISFVSVTRATPTGLTPDDTTYPWRDLPVINYTQVFNGMVLWFGDCGQTHPMYWPYSPENLKNADLSHFYIDVGGVSCKTMYLQSDSISCSCQGLGYFASFTEGDYLIEEIRVEPPPTTLEEFLGFPYSEVLYYVSHVLRAVSLVCLLATVLSFVTFRKARKGLPTLILLHLCTCLILLLILLYITEPLTTSKLGCTVANVLRYYIILVSLLWNGAEAYNMFLMLVKVFESHVSRFLTKATVISWGLPAIGVAIVFAVDQTGFDGYYKDCSFICGLKKWTLYFAFLLPMGIIILHNIVVFGLVLRVLIRHSQDNVHGQEPRHSHWVRLCGAVSMLVLLGVPWVFSSFGAIDPNGNNHLEMLEGVFQVVAVVFINLQGMFIFAFHCARNTTLKEAVKSSLGMTTISSTGTHSLEVPVTNRHSNKSTHNTDVGVENNAILSEK